LQRRFQLIDTRIALYRALAGGWQGLVPPVRDGDAAATQPAASQPAAGDAMTSATQPMPATRPTPATQPAPATQPYQQ
jgi:hypothetical protein